VLGEDVRTVVYVEQGGDIEVPPVHVLDPWVVYEPFPICFPATGSELVCKYIKPWLL
jgi:hypothetical protein